MALIPQMAQIGWATRAELICEISVICVLLLVSPESRPVARDDRDSSTPRFALRSE